MQLVVGKVLYMHPQLSGLYDGSIWLEETVVLPVGEPRAAVRNVSLSISIGLNHMTPSSAVYIYIWVTEWLITEANYDFYS